MFDPNGLIGSWAPEIRSCWGNGEKGGAIMMFITGMLIWTAAIALFGLAALGLLTLVFTSPGTFMGIAGTLVALVWLFARIVGKDDA